MESQAIVVMGPVRGGLGLYSSPAEGKMKSPARTHRVLLPNSKLSFLQSRPRMNETTSNSRESASKLRLQLFASFYNGASGHWVPEQQVPGERKGAGALLEPRPLPEP